MLFRSIREYTDAAGHPLQKVELGARINVHLKFRAIGNRGIQEVAIVDLLPGGFDLVSPLPGNNAIFADPREDRVVFYVTVSNEVQELDYSIKATNVGSYTVPPAYGEAMYDRNLVARSPSGRVEVVRP